MKTSDIAVLEAPLTGATGATLVEEDRAFCDAVDGAACRQLTLGLVHEMNNVLGGIAVLSEIYQDAASTDDGLGDGLALIHKSTGRLQTLVGHLKTLNGPAVTEPVYLNLSETVRSLFEMFAPLLPKTLAVETLPASEELVVRVDEAALRRVLLNLTLNLRDTLDELPAGTGTLRVVIRRRTEDFAEVCCTLEAACRPAAASLAENARARLIDARRCLGEMGGTLIANTGDRFVLALPLAA